MRVVALIVVNKSSWEVSSLARRHRPEIKLTQENDSQRCIGFALVLAANLVMTGCGPSLTVDLYDGLQRGDKDVATIMPQDGCWHCVKWLGLAEKNPIYTDSYPITAMNETYPVPESSFDSPVFVGKFRIPREGIN